MSIEYTNINILQKSPCEYVLVNLDAALCKKMKFECRIPHFFSGFNLGSLISLCLTQT